MTIDVEALRRYLLDYYGSAMVAGCGPAFIDLTDIERADAGELAHMAERIGVDPAEFSVG